MQNKRAGYDDINLSTCPTKGNPMQIELSRDEYKTLLGILEISFWVLRAHHTQEPEDRKKFHDFEQKIYGYAKEMGFDELIQFDEDHQMFFPTRQHDDNSEVRPFIDEFENDSFWVELIDRLSNRDTLRKYGQAKLSQMSTEDRFKAMFEFEEKYEREFEQHGISRMEIKYRRW